MDKNNKLGQDPFFWWTGVVEDRQDPLMLGRCRVRILGVHTDDKTLLPTASLPWAHPLQPINNPTSYTAKEGDMVVGFFMDSTDAQFPVMFGLVPGVATKPAIKQKGFYDNRTTAELNSAPVKPNESATNYPRNLDEPTTSRLARNENLDKTLLKTKSSKIAKFEPKSYYNAKYPYNNVYESESGHVLEFDDTKSNERIHLYHRAGTFMEMGPDGSKVEKIEKDNYTIIMGNDKVYIKGDVNIVVDGNMSTKVGGSYSVSARSISLSAMTTASMSGTASASVSSMGSASLSGTAKASVSSAAMTSVSGSIVNISAGGVLSAFAGGSASFVAGGTVAVAGSTVFLSGFPSGGQAATSEGVDAVSSEVASVEIETGPFDDFSGGIAESVNISADGAAETLSGGISDVSTALDGNLNDFGGTLDNIPANPNESFIGSLSKNISAMGTGVKEALAKVDISGSVQSTLQDTYKSISQPFIAQASQFATLQDKYEAAKTFSEKVAVAKEIYASGMSVYGTVQQLSSSLSTGAIASQLLSAVTSNVTGQVADNLKNNENIKKIQDNVKTAFDSYTDKVKASLKDSSASKAVEKAVEDVKLRKEYISQEVATAMVNKRNMGGTETEISEAGAETMKKLVDGSITETLPNYPNSVNETVTT